MYKKIDFIEFCEGIKMYPSNFTDLGLEKLFDYFKKLESIGNDIEFDADRIANEYTEYTKTNLIYKYGKFIDFDKLAKKHGLNDIFDGDIEIFASAMRMWTIVINIDDKSIIVKDFE